MVLLFLAAQLLLQGYVLQIASPTGAMISETSLPIAAFPCGQPKVTLDPIMVKAPLMVAFDDPADPTKDCIYTDPGNGPLSALSPGADYHGTLVALYRAVSEPVAFRREVDPCVTEPLTIDWAVQPQSIVELLDNRGCVVKRP